MSLYRKFAAGVLFPLHERLKSHSTVALHRRLEHSQWLPRDALLARQNDDLCRFLADIGQRVPYYRDLFAKRGFDPADASGRAALTRLPFLDKATIRSNRDRMVAEGAGPLTESSTGGSTGEPLKFPLGLERVSHDVAAKRRATRWWDVDIGDRELVIWGSPVELGAQDRIRELRDALFRTRLCSAFTLSEARLEEIVADIRRRPPRMLFGYPSSLATIADFAAKRGIRLDGLGIRVAFVTSERLYDHQRESIETVFGCPVANGYGGRDAGFIAHECPEGSLHITSEDIIVEVVDEEGRSLPPGETGEIVTTHLRTADFPFVRYRTGDVGRVSVETCACGRGLEVLASIEGRSNDFVVARNGTRMHGASLTYIMRSLGGIRAFKIIQESRETITVQLQLDASTSEAIERQIREDFCRRLGPMNVSFEYPEEIPREGSGKFRFVVSKVGEGSDRGAA